MRIGVLASQEGSLLQAVLDACADSRLRAGVVVLISNNSNCGAVRRAKAAGIPTVHLSAKTHPNAAELDEAITEQLAQAQLDVVLLAGYMKRLGPTTLSRFHGRIINTHPALLPNFGGTGMYGRRVHEAVLDAAETKSGATIHWVEGHYDTGPIIERVEVPICANETVESLEAKVKVAERKLLVDTLIRFSNQYHLPRTNGDVI